MPKHTSRLPGQPLQERPWAEPYIPEMLSRTLFREPTLARRQRQAQVQVQAQAQRPRVSIQTIEESYSLVHPPTPISAVSPETEPRFPGIVSPVSPLTPEMQVPSQDNTQQTSIEITLEPATPASELQPLAHWYFHDQDANHYPEKHVSISTWSAYTTLRVSSFEVEGGEARGKERGRGKGKGVSVRRSVKRVRVWLREREEVKGRIGGRIRGRSNAWDGELVVRERVLVESLFVQGVEGENEDEDEGKGKKKGFVRKVKGMMRRGSDRLRKLGSGEAKKKEGKMAWRDLKRIRGFQDIE